MQSGHFRVVDGAIVQPSDQPEPRLGLAAGGGDSRAATGSARFIAEEAGPDFSTDVEVQGSLCVGFDCNFSESYGFDTVRLKENNLRIHFNDTSNSGSFPTVDWRLLANDTGNGGASHFSVENSDTGQRKLYLQNDAKNHAIHATNAGVGLHEDLPVLDLHITEGDSPAIRLEQDGSSGFTAQTFDIVGNEANFFVRDVTNGSALVLRIKPGAGENALFIANGGNVGLGTASPQQRLHMTGGNARFDNGSSATVRLELRNSGSSDSDYWEYNAVEAATDHFLINKVGSGVQELRLNSGGNLIIAGDLTANGTFYPSSRTLKEGFSEVDNREVLARLAKVPVSMWTYKSDANRRPHIGPVTEDFGAVFDFLHVDGKLNTIDLHGVAMAAIQGLNELVAEKDARIDEVEAQNAELEKRLSDLENRFESQ